MKRLFFLLFVLTLTIACAALAESAPQMAPPRPLETPSPTAVPEETAGNSDRATPPERADGNLRTPWLARWSRSSFGQ